MRFPVSRVSVGALLVVLVTCRPISLFGEDATTAHVAVVRFANETGLVSYDAACKAATDTLVMTLSQLGRYRVQSEDTVGSGEDALRAMAEEQQLDFIMYGAMSKSVSGIDCKLSVFDRARGKTTLSQSRKAAGVLDIFDTTDELVVSVLESMTGSHIGFGAITLTNTGEKGSYSVLVDGSPTGSDLTSLDRVLNGRRTVTIVQKRMLGDREVARSRVEVKEGETAKFSFAVPYLMDDEKRKVEGLRAAIRAEWNVPNAIGDVDAKIAELASLFGDVSYSPKLSTYKDEATELSGEWALRKNRLAIETSAWEPKIELLDAAGALYSGAKAYPNSEEIRKTFVENAQLVATLFELEAGKALGDGDIDKGLRCFENALMLSTRYLDGTRLTDYAYAVTILKDYQDKAGTGDARAKGDKDLKTVFGALIVAGQRFFDLREQVEAGTACALVASDVATQVSVDGGNYVEVPIALQSASGSRTVSIQPKGVGKPITLTAPAGGKLLFIPDGFASFGKIVPGGSPTSEAKDTVPAMDDDPITPIEQEKLGYRYENGIGKPKSYDEAVKWYRKAADQGFAAAQADLGSMYANGWGVPKDSIEALKLFRLAADKNQPRAQNGLGAFYEQGTGLQKNYDEAARWYREAAEQGNARAQFNLGRMYENGRGVSKDYGEAATWYQKAAENGLADGQLNLGYLCEMGWGVPKSSDEALKWYHRAADQGNSVAQDNLGFMYENGQGVPTDLVSAYMWYSIEAASLVTGDNYNKVVTKLNLISDKLTPDQLAKAQKRAQEWKPNQEE
jgi:TPR repeat protein